MHKIKIGALDFDDELQLVKKSEDNIHQLM